MNSGEQVSNEYVEFCFINWLFNLFRYIADFHQPMHRKDFHHENRQ